MRWITRLFSTAEPEEKTPFRGWESTQRIVVVYDENVEEVMALVDSWRMDGKTVRVLKWITPKAKDKNHDKNTFSERNIRFGRFTSIDHQDIWKSEVLVDFTTSTHGRFRRLLRTSRFNFTAGLNTHHSKMYDFFVSPKGNFNQCLATLDTYLKCINKQKSTI